MQDEYDAFKQVVWSHYHDDDRGMPWREDTRPYYIFLSEIMLQQTQVSRVIPKFQEFVSVFPDFQSLAESSLQEVLLLWSGLGYNRRARFLWLSAQAIADQYGGVLPSTRSELEALPGIGPNTAGAILAYAHNQPATYIETNIRSVYLHHFFNGQDKVDDTKVLPLIEQTLDRQQPRKWYWALMDYGSHLKATRINPSRGSKHHTAQSKFEGSVRQLRGRILRELLSGPLSKAKLSDKLNDPRLAAVLKTLRSEEFIEIDHDMIRIRQ